MAQVQNGVNLANFVRDYPALAALATSSFASPFLGLWTYNGAPLPGYGRLLTSSEAHGTPDLNSAETPASPNVLPIDVFGHPNTIMYSPAPPAIASSPQLPIDSPAFQSFDAMSNFTTPEHAMKTFHASEWLVCALGVMSFIGCVVAGRQAYKKKYKKSMDTDALVAFLQNEVNKMREENSELQKQRDHARFAISDMQVSRALVIQSQEEAKKHRLEFKKCQSELWKFERDLDKSQNESDVLRVGIGESRRAEKTLKTLLDNEKALHATCKQSLGFQKNLAEEMTKEAFRNKAKIEKMQEQHDSLLQRIDSLESELKSATTQIKSLSADLARQNNTIAEKDLAISDLLSKQKELQRVSEHTTGVLTKTKTEHEALQVQCTTQREELESVRKSLEENDTIISGLQVNEAKIQQDLHDKLALVKKTTKEISDRDRKIKQMQPKILHLQKCRSEKDAAISELKINEKNLSDKIRELQAVVAKLEADRTELGRTHAAELEEVKLKTKDDVSKLRQRHEKNIEDLKQTHATDNAEIKSKTAAEMAALRQQHEKNIEGLNKAHDTKIAEVTSKKDTEMDSLRQQHGQAVEDLKQQHDTQTATIKSKAETDRTALLEQHKKAVEDLKQKYDTETAEMTSKKDTEMDSLRQQHKKIVEDLQKTHATDMAALRQHHEKETAELSASQQHDAGEKDEETARLMSEVTELKSQLREKEDALREKQAKILSHETCETLSSKKIKETEEEVTQLRQEKADEMKANADLQEMYDAEVERTKQQTAGMDELQSQHKTTLNLKDEELAAEAQLTKQQQVKIDELTLQLQQSQQSLTSQIADSKSALDKKELEISSERQKSENANKQQQDCETKLAVARTDLTNLQAQHDSTILDKDQKIASHVSTLEEERQKNTTLHEQLQDTENSYQISVAKIRQDLEMSQDEIAKLQKQHDATFAQKDQELASQSREKIQDLEELLGAKTKEVKGANDEIAEMKAFLIDESARAETFKELAFSNRGLREAFKWTLYKGIADRGVLAPKQMIRLKLPHADPYYSDLPKPFPKPCKESDTGDKSTCDACGETYLKKEYHDHGPACLMFFANYAIRCPGCNGIFHRNDEYQVHEKYCKKYATPGPTPEVFNKMPYVRAHDILAGRDLVVPESSSPQHVMSLKASIPGFKSTDTLYRVVLPHLDSDYDNCHLPFPKELGAILSTGWPNGGAMKSDVFAGRRQCRYCKEWYLAHALHAHLQACKAFFQGDDAGTLLPHSRCEHCGDFYVANKAYRDHKVICSADPTAAPCEFCGYVFTKEPIKFPDGSETVLLGRVDEHAKYCHLNPHRHHIPEWMTKFLDGPPSEEHEKPSMTTPPATATTTTTTTTSHAPAPSPSSFHTHNLPRIATNGYQQPQSHPQSRSPSSLLSSLPSFGRAPRPSSVTPPRPPTTLRQPTSQAGSPSSAQRQAGNYLAKFFGSQRASQPNSPSRLQQSSSSPSSTPSPSPVKPEQDDGAT